MTNDKENKKLIWTEEELPQGSDEWLEWRRGTNRGQSGAELTLGGSEVAGLMYMSPWKTPTDIFERKMGIREDVFSDQAIEAMERGNILEPFARRHYENLTGMRVRQLCALHPEYDWMRTSLDGISDDNRVIQEIKSPSSLRNHIKQTKDSRVVAYRYPQLQWQIAVMREHFEGVERVDYVSYYVDASLEELQDGGFEKAELFVDMVIIPVFPDEDFIRELIRRGKIFIERHLATGTPPPDNLFMERDELTATVSRRKSKKYAPGTFF